MTKARCKKFTREKKSNKRKRKSGEPKILLIFASWHSALSGVRMLCVGMSFACMSCENVELT